jgi:thymidine phosphorylase
METVIKNDKELAINVIENLNDDVSNEEILYTIYVAKKVQNGIDDIHNNRTISHEEVATEIKKWRQ